MSTQVGVREISHFIGGQQVAGTSGTWGDVFDPSSGQVQARVALATADEVRAAIDDGSAFASARDLPAWLGLVPR